jgi:hypothetical protein
MGQEFIIKSQGLEDKINQLLPSQGGFAAGVDLSASTTVIPIVDLTETAEGSALRQDLQTALSHGSITTFSVSNATSTLINTTGYYRVFGAANFTSDTAATKSGKFTVSDGFSGKDIVEYSAIAGSTDKDNVIVPFDFVIFLEAGHSLTSTATNFAIMSGSTRQLADISGNLVNP